jgi:hypothetical protein
MLKPITSESSEPLVAWINQGDFPTLTDQGEQHAPGEIVDPSE